MAFDRFFFWLLFVPLLFASHVPWVGDYHWFADLFTHFRVHYLVGFALVCAAACYRGYWLVAGCCLGHALWLLVLVWPYLFGVGEGVLSRKDTTLSVIVFNVNQRNPARREIQSYLANQGVDCVSLIEFGTAWNEILEPLAEHFPHQFVEARDDNFGLAILCRYPFLETQVFRAKPQHRPSLEVLVDLPATAVRIFVTHPPPPLHAYFSEMRNEQLESLGERTRSVSEPVIVAGDLNVTPWSGYYRRLLKLGQLRNAADGEGILVTWPAHFFPLGIPIDHFLVSSGVGVNSVALGPAFGSDHFSLIGEFWLSSTAS